MSPSVPQALKALSTFEFHPTRGFLPEEDPLTVLPPAFAAWDAAARDLPKLLASSRLRQVIDKLPVCPIEKLNSRREIERAMMVLSYIGHAYVWYQAKAADRIPGNLARPWFELSQKLGRPPVLSYASYALHNWRRIDPQGPIEVGNVVLLQNFFGGIDEEWFILIHVAIEAQAAPGIQGLAQALMAAAANDAQGVQQGLQAAATSIEKMSNILFRMPEWCDPYIYFHRVRPYIHGWKNNPALPNGLIYSDVQAYGDKPQQFRGETGSQSSIVPCFDAALGVGHKDDPLKAYLLEMQEYMPPKHRELMRTMEQAGSVRPFVIANKTNQALVDVYNSCVTWIEKFRSKHLEYAAAYINKQSATSLANPSAVGTGGTPFMKYLGKHRDETGEHLIK